MISKKSVIYRFLCIWWVLITMAPRNSLLVHLDCGLQVVLYRTSKYIIPTGSSALRSSVYCRIIDCINHKKQKPTATTETAKTTETETETTKKQKQKQNQ